jgi:hypothetical protein
MKENIEKHISSSPFPKTIAIESFINFDHSNALWKNI